MNRVRHIFIRIAAILLLLAMAVTSAAAEYTMKVKVTVPVPEYYVEVPQSISFADLNSSANVVKNFKLILQSKYIKSGYQIKITAPETFHLVYSSNSDSKLPCHNSLYSITHTGSSGGTYNGTLTIYKSDIQNAPSGKYSGTLSFDISYEKTEALTQSDGSYTASVSMRKSDDFNVQSMCNPLFYPEADITISGDYAKVKLYVIDPIPAFSSEGVPLSWVKFTYDGKTYTASINSTSKVTKSYAKNATFIPTAGNYASDIISVTLPKAAIADSAKAKLLCNAYVNAVMKTEVSFYPVFGDLISGSTAEATGAVTEIPETVAEVTEPVTEAVTDTAAAATITDAAAAIPAAANTGASGATTAAASSGSSGGLSSGNYTCRVVMKKSTDITANSMCDPLIYSYADLSVNGDMTTMTIYVINPIPQYSTQGTPLANISFVADSKTYSAAIDGSNTVSKSFAAASGFIPSAGTYPASPITVTVPTAAIVNSAKGTLLCKAYVAVVMNTDVSFYVVCSDFTGGSSAAASGTAAGSGGAETTDGEDTTEILSGEGSDAETPDSSDASSGKTASAAAADGLAADDTENSPICYTLITQSPVMDIIFAAIAIAAAAVIVLLRKKR